MTSNYADILGGRIHYISYAQEGEPASETLIFLHGNSSSAGAIAAVAKGLVHRAHVIGIDLPGHGRSDGEASFKNYFSFQGCREILLRTLDAIGIQPTGIIGHSMGGHIAMQAAPDIPSLSHLILISSPPIAGRDALAEFFRPDAPTDSIFAEKLSDNETQQLARAFTSSTAPKHVTNIVEADIAQTDGCFRRELGVSLSGADVVDELAIAKNLKSVDCFFIGGEADRFIQPAYYVRVVRELGLREERRCVFPAIGHYPHLESPEQVLRVIERWLMQRAAAC
ncbi:MAG: alpha/beta fold hydrolase [Methylovirgula sp.]